MMLHWTVEVPAEKKDLHCSSLNRCIFSYFEYYEYRRLDQAVMGNTRRVKYFITCMKKIVEQFRHHFSRSKYSEHRRLDQAVMGNTRRVKYFITFMKKIVEQFRHHFSRSKIIIEICMFKVEFVFTDIATQKS